MYGKQVTKCWVEESTLCVHPHMDEDFFKRRGLNKCDLCLYKQSLSPEKNKN